MLPQPDHVAIIMDGNRRWAKERDLTTRKGHEKGKEALEDVLEAARDLEIKHITIWALSLDNMVKRSKEELNYLMGLFEKSFLELIEDERIHENNIKVNVLGRWQEELPQPVVDAIQKAIDATKNYSDYFLNFLISYSGKDEMLQAIRKILEKERNGKDVEVNSEEIKKHLFTSDLPPVDLMIRTGGEPHNSAGFMMWDIADSQFYFSDKYWPEFRSEEFKEAVEDYRNRERRYGE